MGQFLLAIEGPKTVHSTHSDVKDDCQYSTVAGIQEIEVTVVYVLWGQARWVKQSMQQRRHLSQITVEYHSSRLCASEIGTIRNWQLAVVNADQLLVCWRIPCLAISARALWSLIMTDQSTDAVTTLVHPYLSEHTLQSSINWSQLHQFRKNFITGFTTVLKMTISYEWNLIFV